MPKWSQFRYLGNFLSKTEKRIVNLALVVLFIATAGWGVNWFFTNSAIVPASGGDYSEAMVGQPKYINPLFATANDVDADLASLIFSGLFSAKGGSASGGKSQLVPDLASDYTVSADGKIYDINLRKDAKWTDNEPLTANDVVYTFETIADPEVGSPLIATFQSITIEQTGDYSVRFTLKEPFAPFLSSLTVGILPQHVWANAARHPTGKNKFTTTRLGSKFSKLTKDSSGNIQSYSLDRNEIYYPPHLKTLTFKFYTDYSLASSILKIKM